MSPLMLLELSIADRDAPQEVIVADSPQRKRCGPVADRGFVDTVRTQTTEVLEAGDFPAAFLGADSQLGRAGRRSSEVLVAPRL